MTKQETSKLLNNIKGYYNNQFFVDEYVIEAWAETMEPYDLEDAIKHIQDYLKEYPDEAPKPHIFKRGMLTHDEKMRLKNSDFTVECNLCHRWMPLEEYENHYDKCLDIQYLISVAKQKGEDLTRQDLENQPDRVLNGLIAKYPPEKPDTEWGLKQWQS